MNVARNQIDFGLPDELARHLPRVFPGMSFGGVLGLHIEELDRSGRAGTAQDYRSCRDHRLKLIVNMPVERVSAAALIALRHHLATKEGGDYSASSIDFAIDVCRATLAKAKAFGLVAENAAAQLPRSTRPKARALEDELVGVRSILTPDEDRALFSFAKGGGAGRLSFVVLLWMVLERFACLRPCEVAGLFFDAREPSPVDGMYRCLAIRWHYIRKVNTIEPATKTGVNRYTPELPIVTKLLDYNEQVYWPNKFGRKPGPTDIVAAAVGENGDPTFESDSWVQTEMDRVMAARKIMRRTHKDLRRTGITKMRAAGVPQAFVERMTHTRRPRREIERYAHHFDWARRHHSISFAATDGIVFQPEGDTP